MKYFKTMNAVAILTGGWVGHGPPKIFAGLLFGPPGFFLISRSSSFGSYICSR